MNLTNDEFAKIEKALQLLPYGDEFDSLSEEDQKIIVDADSTMLDLLKKQKANNQRTAEAIAKKRQTDPGYARSREDKTKYLKKD